MNLTNFQDKLNDDNLLTTYGLIIQTGTATLLEFPARKDGVENDWREYNGIERDLELVRFREKEAKLECAFIADDDAEFWQNYNAFFHALTQDDLQELYIEDHSKTYEVSYKKTAGWVKGSKTLKGVDKVFVKFSLALRIH